jgi:squalene synthase HpnC
VVERPAALTAAYAHCEQLAREHYENFPVASVLLPARMRPHIAAIYAFARTADDYADEPGRSPAERLLLLDEWERRLQDAARGVPGPAPIFLALADTMEQCQLPQQLFTDLLSAFRQDITVHRYSTWTEVLDYCRRSANPVGRLVLGVAGVRDPETQRASDAVCTALQLANFWQDFGRDFRNGRIYVPREEMLRAGASEAELTGATLSPAWRAAVRACVERTHALFTEGRTVADRVSGRLRFELRATWLGGMRILAKIEGQGYDTLHRRPTLTKVDVPLIALKALAWRSHAQD